MRKKKEFSITNSKSGFLKKETVNKLTPSNEASIQESKLIVDDLNDGLENHLEKDWSFTEKLTSKLYSQTQVIKSKFLHTSAISKLAIYKTETEARLALLNEQFDTRIKLLKAESRSRLSTFLLQKHQILSEEVESHQYIFYDSIKKKYAFLDTIDADSPLYAKWESMIQEELDTHMDFIQRIMSKFQSLIDEEIQPY